MVPPKFEVVLMHGGILLTRKTLSTGAYVIGRSPEAEIFIETPLLSRQHARLVVQGESLSLDDLESRNGTFIDGERVSGSVEIFPGQVIKLGDITLEIQQQSDHSTEAPRSEPRYEVGEQIARGGMGAILAARQRAIRREVAMKVMLGDWNAQDRRRFIAEAQITGQLEHPNIVPVHELSVDDDGQPYYTMKMVRGTTLKDVLASISAGDAAAIAKYSLPALVTIFQKVCDGVAFAHGHQVIHRDLKPANIMLGDYGEVLVMDWGLAKTLKGHRTEGGRELQFAKFADADDSGAAEFTMAGTILGTPAYMSPEQASGKVDGLDGRSDIYALGAILFHILHLRAPYTGQKAVQIIPKVQRGAIEWKDSAASRSDTSRPATRRGYLPSGQIPDSLLAVVRKAMAFEREQRYATVEDLQADVSAYQNGFATSAENAGFGRQLLLALKRHKAVATSIAASLLLLVGISVAFTKRIVEERNRAVNERERAETESERALKALDETEKARRRTQEALIVAEEQRIRAENALAVAEEQRKRATQALADAEVERARANTEQTRAERERLAAQAAQDRATAEAVRARNAMENVKVETTRAERALAELKKSADDIFVAANALVESGQVREALTKVEQAVQIDGKNADYLLLRANLLEATEQLEPAVATYRQVLQMRPSDPMAQSNLEICERLIQINGGSGPLRPELQQELLNALHRQKRVNETGPLVTAIGGPAIMAARATLRERLKPFVGQSGWSDDRIVPQPDGTFSVNLDDLRIETLKDLADQPISALSLAQCPLSVTFDLGQFPNLKRLVLDHNGFAKIGFASLALTDLTVVRGKTPGTPRISNLRSIEKLPLQRFALINVDIAELGTPASSTDRARERVWEPLASAPLTHLTLQGLTRLTEIPQIIKEPLEYLDISGTGINSLTPLRNCHTLHTLIISKSRVANLGALSNLRLTTLAASGCRIYNLSGLERHPLKRLFLDGTNIHLVDGMSIHRNNVESIAQFADLEELTISLVAAHKGYAIRGLPRLRLISSGERDPQGRPSKTAQQFWADFDRGWRR
jgi:serine/threonine protein kinase